MRSGLGFIGGFILLFSGPVQYFVLGHFTTAIIVGVAGATGLTGLVVDEKFSRRIGGSFMLVAGILAVTQAPFLFFGGLLLAGAILALLPKVEAKVIHLFQVMFGRPSP